MTDKPTQASEPMSNTFESAIDSVKLFLSLFDDAGNIKETYTDQLSWAIEKGERVIAEWQGVNYNRLRSAPAVDASREVGWLIERYCGDGGRPMYMRLLAYGKEAAKPHWTEDSFTATRFANKQSAVNVAHLFPDMCCLAKITEHVWIGGKDVQAG